MGNMLSEFTSILGTDMRVDGNFKQNLEKNAKRVSEDFVKYNKDMDSSIAKIAGENGYNDEQIQRLVEESNNQTYLAKYAGMKNQSERDVSFKVASLSAVKEILGDSMSKSASENFHIDAFSSYNPYRTGAIECYGAEDQLKKSIAEKIASDLSEANNNYIEASEKFDAHIYKVADMMIRYDRVGGVDINDIYDKMCKEAKLKTPVQFLIQKVANQIIEDEKFTGSINSDYELKLPHVDIYEVDKDFSLGNFSCMKKNASYFPVMQLGENVIGSIDDMIKIAKETRPLFEKASEAKLALTNINSKFGDVNA